METTAFANLNLRVEQYGDAWRAEILDLAGRETLQEIACTSQLVAKTAAVDFALARLFGPQHGKDLIGIVRSLDWRDGGVDELRTLTACVGSDRCSGIG